MTLQEFIQMFEVTPHPFFTIHEAVGYNLKEVNIKEESVLCHVSGFADTLIEAKQKYLELISNKPIKIEYTDNRPSIYITCPTLTL